MEKDLYQISRYYLAGGDSHTFRADGKYRIILVIQGFCKLCDESQRQLCHSEDMLLLEPGEVRTLETYTKQNTCALLCVKVSAESLAKLSDPTCDLTEKFGMAPYGTNVIRSEVKSFMLIYNMLQKLDTLENENIMLGTGLYERSLFTAFLILFLRTCIQSNQIYQARQKKVLIIDDVFKYVSRHLTDDLSLKTLESEFFISGEHISREFKKRTGMTLHAYITRSRIDMSKKYLLQGIRVKDVCQMCGFCSYNHFFRVFREECGMTPKAYYRKMCDTKG